MKFAIQLEEFCRS